MHDLVHDLARSVMADEILVTGIHGNTGGSCCRYALLNDCSNPLESSKIRALRFMDCGEIKLHDAAFSSAKSLRVLDLSECFVEKLPDSIGLLKQLRYLNAPRVQHSTIPDSMTKLSKLIYLNLHGSSTILMLPESIGEIGGLMYLDLSGCSGIEKLPESLVRLKKLVHLDLSNCSRVGDVSLFLGSLTELQYLNLSYCLNIGELPETLSGLSELQYLNLSSSSYLELCQEVEVLGVLTKLEYLNLSSGHCYLLKLPEALGRFAQLKYLNLSGCQHMKQLPRLFGNLKNLEHLDLSNCDQISVVPEALGGLTKLQYLNLSVKDEDYYTQCLAGLPEVISNLTELRYLNLSGRMCSIFGPYSTSGQIESFINCFSTLSNLEHLDLSNNPDICSIPGSLNKLKKLHTLDLSHCTWVKEIPESISTIDSLKFLYFGCSRMDNLPQFSSSLTTLPLFMVHAGESSSNLVLLKHMNPNELEITKLENVKSAEEARSMKLMEKQNLEKLTLKWTRNVERFVDDNTLLEKLMPPRTLQNLEIQGYNGVSFPTWLMCQLPNLRSLVLRDMESLEEWNTLYSNCEEYVMNSLEIYDCPKLRMKPFPPKANVWVISNSDNVLSSWEECVVSSTSASSYYSPVTTSLRVEYCMVPVHQWRLLRHFVSLTYLSIDSCSDLIGSPEIIRHLSSVVTLCLRNNNQEELPQWLGELSSLQDLYIYRCHGLKELPEKMRQLTKLLSLELCSCDSIASLPHWLGELTSLKELSMWDCEVMSSLPKSIQQLTSLRKLEIGLCPELKHMVDSEEENMKLTHNQDRVCVLPTSLEELKMEECDGIRSLPVGMHQLTNLQELSINECHELIHWGGSEKKRTKPTHIQEMVCVLPTSLKKLDIQGCPSLRSLPEGIQQLTNLQMLKIGSCHELKQWSELEENEMKLAHIESKLIW